MVRVRVPHAELREYGALLPVRVGIGSLAEEAIRRNGGTVRPPVSVVALVDTGAARSVLQQGLAAELGLNTVGSVEIDTPSSKNLTSLEYMVRVWFNDRSVLETKAMEAPLPVPRIRLLLGRDLLAHGTFTYLGREGEFRLSF